MSWSGVSTLGRVVAHWRGLSRVARVSPCAALSGRRAGTSGLARISACHGCSTAGHSRDTGQGTVGEPLAAAEGSGGDCGGCASKHHQLLWDRPCCSCSAGHQHQPAAGQCHLVVSTGGDPPNCLPTSPPSCYPVIRTGRGGANYTVLGNEDL